MSQARRAVLRSHAGQDAPRYPWTCRRTSGPTSLRQSRRREGGGGGPRPVRGVACKAARGVLAGHSLVVPNGEAGEECLEALLQRQLVIARVTREAALLDLDALVDYLVDQIGVLVAEERAHRVEARVHQRVEE